MDRVVTINSDRTVRFAAEWPAIPQGLRIDVGVPSDEAANGLDLLLTLCAMLQDNREDSEDEDESDGEDANAPDEPGCRECGG